MKLDFNTWPEGELSREISVSANDLHLRSETCKFNDSVAISVTVQRTESQVVVAGRIRTVATATCVRCLEEFPVTVDEPLRAVVRVVPSEEAKEDTGDDEFFLIPDVEPVWDMAETVRQLIMLAVPENPLCREDCKGLCPGCGRNLNNDSCVCTTSPSHSPFGNLAQLLERSKKSR